MERQKKSTYPTSTTPRHKSVRQTSGNFIYEIYSSGTRRLNRVSNLELFFLAVLGGGFMCLASLVSMLLITDVTTQGVLHLLSGIGITAGFLLVMLTKSALFTEGNIFSPTNFYNASIAQGILRLFRFWLITFIGNIIGAFLFAYLVYLSTDYSDVLKQNLSNLIQIKLLHAGTNHSRTTGELIISGMLASWVIGLVGFFALASRNLINQFLMILLAFIAISATNFQYFPLNLGYFSLNAFLGQSLSLVDVFFYNLLPVSLGNILGASVLAAGPLLYLSKKR